MELKFAYLEGINDSNTFYFETLLKINQIISNTVLSVVHYSFFPPKYTNTLKVDITDINFDRRCNYMFFEWNNKYYYYFIDSVNYINEDVLAINIRMDTLMTYYYDIRILDGIIERRHIDRYTNGGDNINRDYIRENLSDGLFVPSPKYYIVNPNDMKWLIIKSTAEIRVGVNNKRSTWVVSPVSGKEVLLPYGIYVGPMANKDVVITYSDNQQTTVTYPYGSLMAGEKDDRVLNVYVVPFNPIDEITYLDGDPLRLYCDWAKDHSEESLRPYVTNTIDVQGSGELFGWYAKVTQKVHSATVNADPHTFTFGYNDSIDVAYSSRYIPQLYDSNYIRFVYGSETANASYPIEHLVLAPSNNSFTINYTVSLDTGVRTYWMYDDSTVNDKYRYSSIIVDTAVTEISLANDPWIKYLGNVHSRIFANGMNFVSNAADCFVSIAASTAKAKIKTAAIKNNASSWDRRAKRNPRLKKRYAERVANIEMDAGIESMESGANFGSGVISSMANSISDMANAMWSAPTQKQTGNYLDSDAGAQLAIWYQWNIVQDIEFVAYYYHRYGNLVNKQCHNIASWMDEFNNRYYFNYIKFASINIDLRVLAEDDVISDIERRFMDGITMWNYHFNVGFTLNKDNVENSLLS